MKALYLAVPCPVCAAKVGQRCLMSVKDSAPMHWQRRDEAERRTA